MGKNQVNGLELIQTEIKGACYWWLDYRFLDESGGRCEASIDYPSDKEAITALLENKITWLE